MARENKRARDEKRFGKPERLADMFFVEKFALMDGQNPCPDRQKYNDQVRLNVASTIAAKVIDATNVFDYTYGLDGTGTLKYDKSIVNATPPFSECLVEMAIPDRVGAQVTRMGWALQAYKKGEEPEFVYAAMMKHPDPASYAAAHWIIYGDMLMSLKVSQSGDVIGIICPAAQGFIFLDSSGAAVKPPIMGLDPSWYEIKQDDWIELWSSVSFFNCMMSFCFMNCKNVSTTRVDPEPHVNRERRKAGLKPFLRYHTINIEPMKSVLKTEGGVETNGLKKALHVCRGHFATYSDSMLGRKLDKPVTVWRPPHVRGSAKQGIVVSDYDVKSPKGGL